MAVRGEARGRTPVPPPASAHRYTTKPKALPDWLALPYWLGVAEVVLLLHVAGSRARSEEAGSVQQKWPGRARSKVQGPRPKVQGGAVQVALPVVGCCFAAAVLWCADPPGKVCLVRGTLRHFDFVGGNSVFGRINLPRCHCALFVFPQKHRTRRGPLVGGTRPV